VLAPEAILQTVEGKTGRTPSGYIDMDQDHYPEFKESVLTPSAWRGTRNLSVARHPVPSVEHGLNVKQSDRDPASDTKARITNSPFKGGGTLL